MTSNEELLEKIERCIDTVGVEWRQKSDAYFWYERDIQARLLGLLWQVPELRATIYLEQEGISAELPLAHAECPTKAGGKKFDIAIFWQQGIEKYANEVRLHTTTWQKELREIPILAAVEIKEPSGAPWDHETQKDLNKLIENMDDLQVSHGYQLIFYSGKNPRAQQQIEEISRNRRTLWGDRDIRVYFSPCNVPSMTPMWIKGLGSM